jgi:hypothetical protein
MRGDEKPEVDDAVVDRLGRLVRRWQELIGARSRSSDRTGEIEPQSSGPPPTLKERSLKFQIREIGEQLRRQGGSDLMLRTWYRVADRYGCALATRLWHGWESIGGWPP